MRRAWWIGCLLVLAVGFCGLSVSTLDIYFIDVGHGDAIIVDCGDWEALIDIGPDCRTASERVAAAIREHVKDRVIEVFVLTHAHADHFGGFEKVMTALEGYSIAEYWSAADTGPWGKHPAYDAYMSTLGQRFPQATQSQSLLRGGDTVHTGSLTWRVLAPVAPNPYASADSEINANSLVLVLEYGPAVFLFTGDLEIPPRTAAPWTIPSGALVIKAPHHGYEADCLNWVIDSLAMPEVVRMPSLVVFSTDHCMPAAATGLLAFGIPYWTTRASGTIHVHVDEMSAWATTVALAGLRIDLAKP